MAIIGKVMQGPHLAGGPGHARYPGPMAGMIIDLAFKGTMGTKMGYKPIKG